jgi:hypothetical protein
MIEDGNHNGVGDLSWIRMRTMIFEINHYNRIHLLSSPMSIDLSYRNDNILYILTSHVATIKQRIGSDFGS